MSTVIISFDPIPNRDNIDDIKIINHLDIRLHKPDLLPLRITLWHLKQIKRNCDNPKVFILWGNSAKSVMKYIHNKNPLYKNLLMTVIYLYYDLIINGIN